MTNEGKKVITKEALEARIKERRLAVQKIGDPVLREIGELLIKDMNTLLDENEALDENFADYDGSSAGTVQWFNETKGYGFIRPDGMTKDVFVHMTTVTQAGMTHLDEGARVRFNIRRNAKSGKMQAEDLKLG